MTVVRVFASIAGLVVVLLTVRSAIRTILVPRPLQAQLSRAVFVLVRRVFRLRAGERHDYEHRDRVMALYAPVALLALLGTWLALSFVGFVAILWALGVTPLREAVVTSGSSLFTLGFARPEGLWPTLATFVEAATGLFLLALLITYLPSLYSAFQRREAGVSKLEVRAGVPPSGIYLIELAWTVGRMETLHDLWASWEDWFVDVDESHSSFPALAFFRSPHADESWVTAAGAILDGASLYVSSVDVGARTPEPEFMIRSGYLCLRHIADFFGLPVDHDPRPTDPISVTREEFDTAYDRLLAAGVPMKPDRGAAWEAFAGWRVNYDAALLGLVRLTMAPPAPWSSDRVTEANMVPPLVRRSSRRA
ncbi:MAG: hypothetical protein A2Z48_10785 [Actinobacteria bacterium RBG_19FT_COMBO_70_19]|nr:MAG: hypothetical protein A2Z48_10785 [Actinobacteria bacterium RBG_19FT_COMBO_70_19]